MLAHPSRGALAGFALAGWAESALLAAGSWAQTWSQPVAVAKPAKVLAMGLTWRDLVSSVTAAAMVLAYVPFMY
jgi:lipid-binding SYLF domain-containing protein